jgi:hypothetical protein
MAASIDKLRKKVYRLKRKQKWEKALRLQREVCEHDPSKSEEWSLLAVLAREAGLIQVSLAAAFEAAKLGRTRVLTAGGHESWDRKRRGRHFSSPGSVMCHRLTT